MTSEATEELVSAVTDGDLQAVEEALQNGVSPNATFIDSVGLQPLLYLAAQV